MINQFVEQFAGCIEFAEAKEYPDMKLTKRVHYRENYIKAKLYRLISRVTRDE